VVIPVVGNVFQVQHDKDVILVLTGIDDPPKRIAGGPSRLIDLFLRELVSHLFNTTTQKDPAASADSVTQHQNIRLPRGCSVEP
jgi:hypothetical protein